MMSQNRQGDIDREKAFDLHEKVDHIRLNQVWALWDQMQLQQKKLDTIQIAVETMSDSMQLAVEKLANLATQPLSKKAPATPEKSASAEPPLQAQSDSASSTVSGASLPGPPSAGDNLVPPTRSPFDRVFAGASAGAAGEHDGALNSVSPAAAPTPLSPPPPLAAAVAATTTTSGVVCECRPPNMCDACMYALERAEVSAAFLKRANPRWVPTMPSSFPTVNFVQPEKGSHYAQPLEYVAGRAEREQQRQMAQRGRAAEHRSLSPPPHRAAAAAARVGLHQRLIAEKQVVGGGPAAMGLQRSSTQPQHVLHGTHQQQSRVPQIVTVLPSTPLQQQQQQHQHDLTSATTATHSTVAPPSATTTVARQKSTSEDERAERSRSVSRQQDNEESNDVVRVHSAAGDTEIAQKAMQERQTPGVNQTVRTLPSAPSRASGDGESTRPSAKLQEQPGSGHGQ
jgi:hypothetical protein